MLIRKRPNRGEVIIEATIVIPLCLAILFAVIEIGMVLYRQTQITVAANETAYNIAMVYRNANLEPMTGFTTSNEVVDIRPYRYFLWKKDELDRRNKEKAEWYASSLVQMGAISGGDSYPVVRVSVDEGSLSNLRRRINVVVTDTYKIPGGDILKIFGVEPTITIEAKASSDCVDMIDYMNTVGYLMHLEKTLTKDTFLSSVAEMCETWSKVISSED